MADLTVAICTYNGEYKLPELLDHLRSQRGVDALSWEVLVVDNNSSDRTADVVSRYQQAWSAAFPLRYVCESRQGLAFARRRAIGAAQGEWIGFLDDDNLPAANWVQAAYQFGQAHPDAGAYGSRIRSRFESSPPPHFERIACCLAIIERGEQAFQYAPARGVLPAGAGLVVRTSVWQQSVPSQPVLAGVKKKSLANKGEDVETLSYIRKAGYPIWYNPAMVIEHDIPKERLSRAYLHQLFKGIGLSRYPLRMLNYQSWQRPGMTLAHLCYDANKLLTYCLCHWRDIVRQDLVSLCELDLHWYSLVSAPYAAYKNLPNRKTNSVENGHNPI